jgi:hypothetical protein
MLGSRALFSIAFYLVLANSAIAQPGTFDPICAGLKSVAWCHQFDPGLPSAMAVGADGTTYVASAPSFGAASTVTALTPDGSVIYKVQFQSNVVVMALGANGTLWVVADSLYQIDAQGKELTLNYAFGTFIHAAVSDASGSLYLATTKQGSNNFSLTTITKLNCAGVVVGVFPLAAYWVPAAITVDSAGAVYVV